MKQTIGILAIPLLAACAYAADGQVLINQATVNAAGGFPYVISQPGSYKLSGNLILNDANKSAIRLAADFVTLDLGGFSIIGPNDCSSGVCSAIGTGNGIETLSGHVYFNITIRNGTIQGMGQNGILIYGDSYMIEYLHVRSNGNIGIETLRFSLSATSGLLTIVQNCTSELNAYGVKIESGRVSNNDISRNRSQGIFMNGGKIDNNVVIGNKIGLNLNATVAYVGNVLVNNSSVNVAGGVNLGQNLCDASACP